MKTCIAVDIGGTKMLVAEVWEDGSIINRKRFATGNIRREEVVRRLIAGIREYEDEIGWISGKRPVQMGIGVNGLVDPVQGIWKRTGPAEPEIALAECMEREFGLKCYVDNDVKATVIARSAT